MRKRRSELWHNVVAQVWLFKSTFSTSLINIATFQQKAPFGFHEAGVKKCQGNLGGNVQGPH